MRYTIKYLSPRIVFLFEGLILRNEVTKDLQRSFLALLIRMRGRRLEKTPRPLKYLIKWNLVIGFVALMASVGYSQDIRVEAEVSSQKVTLGSTIQFTITIHGTSNIDPIRLPPIDGFEVRYLGPSTRVSIVNGRQTSSKSFIYSLFPLREGKFQIPTFNVIVSGKSYTIPSIPLEVVASMGGVGSIIDNQPTSLQDKLFSVLKVPKEEVYLNESLPMKVLVFISGLSVRDIQYPDLNNIGFSIGEYDQPQQYQQIVNGIRYNIVEFNTKIYPTRVGELQLGPAKITCNIIIPNSRGISRFGRGGIFDDDFFNSFFDRHEKRPVILESAGVNIKVLPLPDEGKPNDFSGAVGEYHFNVSMGPDHVKEGDPITLRMTIIGKGNLSAVQMPSLSFEDNFKIYDPQVFEKGGIKKSEQVIIPQSEQIKEVPAIQFSYFDPQLKKYRTITKGPFPIKVAKLEDGEEFKVVGLNGEYKPFEPEIFGKDIVFIKTRPGKFRISQQHVYNSSLFYVAIMLAIIAWVGTFLNYKRTDRIKTDIAYARRLLASRNVKRGLNQVKRLIETTNKEKFYDAVFKTIQDYLGDKLHLSSGAVTFESVQAKLSSKKIEKNAIDEIKVIFDECDMIRYASADINQDDRSASYQRLANNINYLERHLK